MARGRAEVRHEQVRQDFEQFVAASSERLLRTAYLVVRDGALAEDLVQECLLRVARRWPRVRAMEHPYAYARKILVNLTLDGAKGRQRHSSELDAGESRPLEDRHDEAASRALVDVDTAAELIDALGQLAPRQRAALVLRYFEDLTEAQVAEAMGCSPGTVKSTTWRALERLRQVLANNDTTFDPQCTTT
jgi:RNA polymerase sigma-70 factor (sigma-E family)